MLLNIMFQSTKEEFKRKIGYSFEVLKFCFNPPKRNLNADRFVPDYFTLRCFNPPKRNLNEVWSKSSLWFVTSFNPPKRNLNIYEVTCAQHIASSFNPPKRNLNKRRCLLISQDGEVSIHQRGI